MASLKTHDFKGGVSKRYDDQRVKQAFAKASPGIKWVNYRSRVIESCGPKKAEELIIHIRTMNGKQVAIKLPSQRSLLSFSSNPEFPRA